AEKTREQELAELAEAKAWKGLVFDAGFGWITGPAQYGGRELPGAYDRTWQSLSSRYDTPSQQAFGIGLGMVAPTILAHATDKVKDLYLRDLYRGDIVACQLFSEPGAGSDLAGLQTRAVRDGDEWVVTGQKVWTSGAQFSDIGEIICRTDPDVPKHKGLTGFVVDMRRAADPIARQRLADVYINGAVARYTTMRAMAKIKAGQLPGPEMSIAKLSLTENLRRTADAVSLLLGPRLMADTGEWGTFSWAEFVLGIPGIRVAGGTDEVLRNIIGERVLGLPKDPAKD